MSTTLTKEEVVLSNDAQKMMEKGMDEKTVEQLEKLKNQERNMDKDIDRTLKLFKQLQLQQKVEKAAEEIEKLAEKQDKLGDETKKAEDDAKKSDKEGDKNKEQNHFHDERDFDVFDVKKDFFDVIEIFGLRAESLQMTSSDAPKYYHPHRFAALKLGKNLVGYFGEIHPAIAKKFDLKNRVNLFEIFVEALPQTQKSSARKPYTTNDLQLVERDFAFLVNKDQAIGDLIKTIANCDKQLISDVNIFDIFSGKNIADDKKSVALRVKIQPLEKTLTSEEIDAISKKIIESVAKFYGATLRD